MEPKFPTCFSWSWYKVTSIRSRFLIGSLDSRVLVFSYEVTVTVTCTFTYCSWVCEFVISFPTSLPVYFIRVECKCLVLFVYFFNRRTHLFTFFQISSYYLCFLVVITKTIIVFITMFIHFSLVTDLKLLLIRIDSFLHTSYIKLWYKTIL